LDEIGKVVERLQPKESKVIPEIKSEKIRLTQYTHGLGCACKLRPQLLEKVLQDMSVIKDKRVLVGTETGDDAAVYLINEETALVQTIDFFTPIVDDPYTFGSISAANSLSDIYAMGAKPIFALNIVGFPTNRLPISVLEEILKGAQDKAREAGIPIIGGHTIDDLEPKFGLAVSGVVHPHKVITNSHSKPGDVLILTKPIGTGIISTALKQGLITEAQAHLAIESMLTLNRTAAEVMQKVDVHSCTDVTGFGLLGHLLGMMKGANTAAIIDAESVPIFEGVLEQVTAGTIPGGTKNNYDYTLPFVRYSDKISQSQKMILNDAQTSGGLLIAISEKEQNKLLKLLHQNGIISAVKIGYVAQSKKPLITVN
jgi:cysteine desulfurase